MAKQKIGWIKQKLIVEGDCNLLKSGEILYDATGEYPVIRKKESGEIKTYVIIPLEDLTNND